MMRALWVTGETTWSDLRRLFNCMRLSTLTHSLKVRT
jgi:hypothetical protein